MSELGDTPPCRDHAWLRNQTAPIEQRYLQFERHCRLAPGPATIGAFVPSNRADAFPRQEWVATLEDRTTVVVNDWCDSPSVVGVEKAVSIVQSRAYLEQRARRLLLPFTKEAGAGGL